MENQLESLGTPGVGQDLATNELPVGTLSTLEKMPQCKMTFAKITELCLSKSFMEKNSSDLDTIADKLLGIKVARLGWQGFTSIACLDALTAIQDLHLQYNHITRIENLDFHTKLKFLVLSNNEISSVENILHLQSLELLDLSHNCVEELDYEELPLALRNVDFKGNMCASSKSYRTKMLKRLPKLVILDDVRLSEDNDAEENAEQAAEEGQELEEEQTLEEEKEEDIFVPSKPKAGNTPRKPRERPTSGLGRSDAMMDEAMDRINEMSKRTSLRAMRSFGKHRLSIKERSQLRMQEQEALFKTRKTFTLENTRPCLDTLVSADSDHKK